MSDAESYPLKEGGASEFSFSEPFVQLKEGYESNAYSQHANDLLSEFVDKDGGFALVVVTIMVVAWVAARIQRKRKSQD